MRAKDVISTKSLSTPLPPKKTVDGDMSLLEVLPLLLDSPERILGVSRDGEPVGVIDMESLLEGMGKMLAQRDDSSVITVECQPSQYSASSIAHAVEDADMHLVDLFTRPSDNGNILVTLRVRSLDPLSAISSLQRYGFTIVDSAPLADSRMAVFNERLASLQALINV